MALFVVIHARFHDAQWGIFRDGNLIAMAGDSSKKISKNALPLLEELLNTHEISLSDLSFIAAHQGPAPFTTLRVCLSLINGIAYATHIPLIGVNGLEAFLEDYKQPHQPTVALLNAFSKEVYYGFHDPATGTTSYGCAGAESYLAMIAQEYSTPITFLGNGADMYRKEIEKELGDRATILSHDLVSIESIAKRALASWQRQEMEHHLLPFYLKSSSATMTPSM